MENTQLFFLSFFFCSFFLKERKINGETDRLINDASTTKWRLSFVRKDDGYCFSWFGFCVTFSFVLFGFFGLLLTQKLYVCNWIGLSLRVVYGKGALISKVAKLWFGLLLRDADVRTPLIIIISAIYLFGERFKQVPNSAPARAISFVRIKSVIV